MPVLRVSSRFSGGVLFQPLPSARQQILFHNPPSLKSSEIVIHDTTILERMQEVSSCIPENGKRGILRAGADKNTWPFLFSKKWYHSLSTPIHSAGSGMDGAVCLRETAFLFHHSICAGKSRCRRFLDLVSGKIFPIRREKQLRLSQLYVIVVVHIPSRNGADHAFPRSTGNAQN